MAITAEKKAQIQEVIEEAVAAGTPLTKKLLAERMGVSQPTMANYLHEMGVDLKTMASQLKKPASQAASPTEGDASLLLTDAELKKYIDDIEKVFSDAEKDRAAKESLYQLLKPALLVKGSEMTQADKKDGLVMQWRNYLHAEDRNVISRDSQDDQEQGVRFFGFIQYMDRIGGKEGAYKGLSYIVFPMEGSLYAVTLNVGTDDYGTDEYLARKPGTWRGWKRILEDHANLCTEYEASKFDIKMSLADRGSRITENKNIIPTSRYQTTTLAFAIVDASTIEGLLMMLGMLAQYAEMRGWSQEAHRKLIFALLNKVSDAKGRPGTMEDQTAVEALVKGRRFVVLQGAPGTGKTRLARQLVKEQVEKHPAPVREEGAIPQVFFTQFHAETSYSDFVYGLQPDTETAQLSFKPKEGKLVEAIRAAKALYDGEADKQKVPPVYLIIDEINRANLASVLGPTFYLFEPGLDYDKGVPVEIVPGPQNSLTLTALPPNLYVIATMNTADRSLAVVDFALRRRFAWYTMKPQAITLRDEEKSINILPASSLISSLKSLTSLPQTRS